MSFPRFLPIGHVPLYQLFVPQEFFVDYTKGKCVSYFLSFHGKDPRIPARNKAGYAKPVPPRMHWEPGNQEGGRRLS